MKISEGAAGAESDWAMKGGKGYERGWDECGVHLGLLLACPSFDQTTGVVVIVDPDLYMRS